MDFVLKSTRKAKEEHEIKWGRKTFHSTDDQADADDFASSGC